MTAAEVERFVRDELGDHRIADMIRNQTRVCLAVGGGCRTVDEVSAHVALSRSSAYRALKRLQRAEQIDYVDGVGWVIRGDAAQFRAELESGQHRPTLAPTCSCGGSSLDGELCMRCGKPKAARS